MSDKFINEINRQIVKGIDGARRSGVVCEYPKEFTVIKNGDTRTFPVLSIK